MSQALARSRTATRVATGVAAPEREGPLPLDFERAYRIQRAAALTPPRPTTVKESIIAWLNQQL